MRFRHNFYEIRNTFRGPVYYRFLSCKDKKKEEVLGPQETDFNTFNNCQGTNRPVKPALIDAIKKISQNKHYFQYQHIGRNWV